MRIAKATASSRSVTVTVTVTSLQRRHINMISRRCIASDIIWTFGSVENSE